jgi:ADP-heptose:LPS heptosyltransferase
VTRWPTKNWPIENFLSLAERLSDDWFILFTGSAEDRTFLEMSTGTLSSEKGSCLAGRLSLPEFIEVIGRADLVLTGDSLTMHLAVAKARPLIALFGPTDETRVGPLASGEVIRANVACERCYLRTQCHRRCIEKITVQQVLDVIEHGIKELSAGEVVA